MRRTKIQIVLAGLLLVGCFESHIGTGAPRPDGGVDTGFPDGGFPDGGFPDGGFPDGGFPDGGFPDGGFPDSSRPDGGPVDSGRPDGGPPDVAIDAGPPSRALRCGSGTRLVVAHEPSLDFIREWTLEMWVRLNGAPGSYMSLKGDPTAFTRTHFRVEHLMGGVIQAGYIADQPRLVSATIPLNQWVHLAIVVELIPGNRLAMGLLVDGVRVDTQVYPNDQREALNDGDWRLCNHGGDIDEVRLWTIARADSVIAARRNMRFATAQPSMEAYLPLEEAGQIAIDRTGRGHEGVLGALTTPDGLDPTWINTGPI